MNWWETNKAYAPLTKETLQAAVAKINADLDKPLHLEFDMEYWQCKTCSGHGEKMLGLREGLCPLCDSEIWDISSAFEEIWIKKPQNI